MGKLKTAATVLLTALLLLGCALLPGIAGRVQDKANGSVRYGELQPMYLELGNENVETATAFPILEKLAILQEAYMFPITADTMAMTEEEVNAVSRKALEPYLDAGLIKEAEYSYFMVEPTVAMSGNRLGTYLKFWVVHLVNETDPYRSILLHLDDETGQVLLIDYEQVETDFLKEEQATLLECIADVFLRGLTLDTALDGLQQPDAQVELVELTDKATALSCTIKTVEYGTVLLEIYIYENGFYTCFPKSPD